ncbi:hypothetical protein ACHOLT_00380 [Desulfitobacterium sp. Sab5]|uniref:hypothetical protein n=1 Tax=Desulfitobacterium nosdiversum TaxID=3375356 RepID=UPI003CF2CE5C
MKKKSLLLVLTVVIMLCLGNVQAFGAEEVTKSELIGVEEYSQTMTQLYEKYGWKLEIVDASNYKPVTRDAFKSILSETKKDLIKATIRYNENVDKLLKLKEQNKINIDESNIPNKISIQAESITPLSMQISKPLSGQANFSNTSSFIGNVLIHYSTMSVYDGGNGEFISVDSPGSWYYTDAINLDNIAYDTKGWVISGNRLLVYANASGTITFAFTDPKTGIVIKTQQPFQIVESFTS